MKFHLDVRTKVLLLLMVGICTFVVNTVLFETGTVLFLTIIHFLSDRRSLSWKFVLCYIVLLVLQFAILPVLPDALSMFLSVPVVNFRKMFPCVMAFLFLIQTTKVNEAIATMNKMGLPHAVTITFAVTLRYFPVLYEEWRHIHDAMQIRQISIKNLGIVRGCIKKAECYLVPVLISATRTAENLSAAAMTRGIENPVPKTCRGYRKLELQDYCFIFLLIIFLITAIYIKIKGGH